MQEDRSGTATDHSTVDSENDAGGSADRDVEDPETGNARSSAAADPGDTRGRPEVVVPMDLYKTVTVFSTLFAVALVVGGMIALDVATGRATRAVEEIHLPIAILGVGAIVGGAGLYAFAARFRAEGMGNPKDGDDEG